MTEESRDVVTDRGRQPEHRQHVGTPRHPAPGLGARLTYSAEPSS